jgi:hypothetical protein
MMKLWVNSYLKSTTPTPGAVFSIVTHVVLIVAAVVATARDDIVVEDLSEHSIARLLLPPNRAAGQPPHREMIKYVAISIPEGLLGATVQPVDEIKPPNLISGFDARDAIRLPELPGADSVFSMVDVDSVAERYEWSAAPVYPPGMLEQKLEGFVQAQYVVNADGDADTASFRVLVTTHSEFTKAVRDALPYMRFKPAKIGRNRVQQLVQQEFRFRITTAAADTQRSRNRSP